MAATGRIGIATRGFRRFAEALAWSCSIIGRVAVSGRPADKTAHVSMGKLFAIPARKPAATQTGEGERYTIIPGVEEFAVAVAAMGGGHRGFQSRQPLKGVDFHGFG